MRSPVSLRRLGLWPRRLGYRAIAALSWIAARIRTVALRLFFDGVIDRRALGASLRLASRLNRAALKLLRRRPWES